MNITTKIHSFDLIKKMSTAVLSVAIFTNLQAQTPGTLDNTFDTDGKVNTSFGSYDAFGHAMTIQADGKIVVVGTQNTALDRNIIVVRYNTDGSLDLSFNGDGIVITPVGTGSAEANDVVIQADGKILIAGYCETASSDDQVVVVRYNTDGSLDAGFDTDGIVTTDIGSNNDMAHAIAIQGDGKIIVAGSTVVLFNETLAVRYNTDGSLDTSFDTDGILITSVESLNDEIKDVAIQSDGKIILAGHGNSGKDNFIVIRLNADGSLDAGFDTDGKVTLSIGSNEDRMNSIALQSDGKILGGGYSSNGTAYDYCLVRLNNDGSLDTSFDLDGIKVVSIGTDSDLIEELTLQADGKIIASGSSRDNSSSTGYDYSVVRFNTDGSLDTGFDSDGIKTIDMGTTSDYGYSSAIQTDGKIVVAGYTYGSQGEVALVRIHGAAISSIKYQREDNIHLYVYPNPAQNELTLDLQNDGTVTIYNASGIVVSEQKVYEGIQKIMVDKYTEGLYLFHIKNSQGVLVKAVPCLIH